MRYYAAAIQTAFDCPTDRSGIASRVGRMCGMVESTVAAYEPFFDVRLFAFPEFAHAVPIYLTIPELRKHLAVQLPNEHTDAYVRTCRKFGVFIQTGTFLEAHPERDDVVFNTSVLCGPDGILSTYRKVNPWIPWEVHASPHDLGGDPASYFPVAKTEIGNIGCAICYDWLFPEATRQLAFNGCEVAVRVSAYMDPWGATPPMDWWTLFNRARAAENTMFVVAANQGASVAAYPPFSWPGGSMVVDFDGRILAQADPGPGEKIVVGPIDIGALREERQRRRGHDMRSHLRTEAYTYMQGTRFPPAPKGAIDIETNNRRIRAARGQA
ncbi:MAG: nitrilase [Phycisphaerales bacterium]|nr:nitrilase [Phycisphaerales bacterium]